MMWLAIVFVAIATATRDARAQDVVVERREVPVGAGVPWIGAGTVVSSISTGVALIVATTSTYDYDRLLFIPIFGPFIDLAYRPPSSTEETWARVGLVIDGVAQAAGLAMLIVGTVMHHQKLPKHPRQLIVPIATSGGAGVSFTF
jgi:hypothetical protein